MGMCLQLKGCASDVQHVPVAGRIEDEDFISWHLTWWTMAEWLVYILYEGIAGLMMGVRWTTFHAMVATGAFAMAAAFLVLVSMVMVWWHPHFNRGFAWRSARG